MLWKQVKKKSCPQPESSTRAMLRGECEETPASTPKSCPMWTKSRTVVSSPARKARSVFSLWWTTPIGWFYGIESFRIVAQSIGRERGEPEGDLGRLLRELIHLGVPRAGPAGRLPSMPPPRSLQAFTEYYVSGAARMKSPCVLETVLLV